MAGDVRSIYTVKDGKMVEVISDAPATADKRGMVKPDGVTISVDAEGGMTALGSTPPDAATIVAKDGKLVAQDIAIGGDAGDLASARGQIGAAVQKNYELIPTLSFNDFTSPGIYVVWWGSDTEGRPEAISQGTGVLQVDGDEKSSCTQTLRIVAIAGGVGYASGGIHFRKANKLVEGEWSTWMRMLNTDSIGDGIHMGANGVFSVPEYDGATASDPGTAGLVPPAEAGAGNRFLSPYGDWRYGTTREVLTTTKTLYVRTDGDDANDGSADDAAHAFKTINAAVTYAGTHLRVYSEVVIQVGPGTFTEAVRFGSFDAAFGKITLRGSGKGVTIWGRDNANISSSFSGVLYKVDSLTMRCARTSDVSLQVFFIASGARFELKDVAFDVIDNSTSSKFINCVAVDGPGASVAIGGDCEISVSGTNTRSTAVIMSASAGHISIAGSLAVNGKLFYFAYVRNNGYISSTATYSGSATGIRYAVEYGMINVGGRGPDYLPGDTEGITGTQGVYA